MRLAIFSDIHDNLVKLDAALPQAADCQELICCGDLCSPFIIDELLKGFSGPIHIVFGNNDADLFRITAKAQQSGRVTVYGELCQLEREGLKFAVNHFDYLARPIAQSQIYDVVCFGHNHELETRRYGRTLALNPGSILGAKFPAGKRQDVDSTFLKFDCAGRDVAIVSIDRITNSVDHRKAEVIE